MILGGSKVHGLQEQINVGKTIHPDLSDPPSSEENLYRTHPHINMSRVRLCEYTSNLLISRVSYTHT